VNFLRGPMMMRPPASLSALVCGALIALAAVASPAARLDAQAQGATADERLRSVAYDLFVRYEGTSWEGSLTVFADSAIVIPKMGSCKEMDRERRRVSASRESWPCDGPSNVHDFQLIVDRQNHRATSWKATVERPYEKTTTTCAMTRTDENGKEICIQYEKVTEYRTTSVSGRIDLIVRAPGRP